MLANFNLKYLFSSICAKQLVELKATSQTEKHIDMLATFQFQLFQTRGKLQSGI
jgi:hypothetical protein